MKRISIISVAAILLTMLAVSCSMDLRTTKYSVTFVSNNGSEDRVETVIRGDRAVEPSAPVRDGYTFVEWQKDGEKYDFREAVTSDITLEAVWALKICRVTFVFRNGSEDGVKAVTWGYKVSEPDAPEADGNTFIEWRKDGVKYDFDSAVTSDITIEAAWERIVCRVSFDLPEDCTGKPSDEYIIYGNRVTAPSPDPERVGYTFDGWYLEGEEYDFSSEVTDDIILTSQWTEQYWVVSFILSPSTERLPSLKIRNGATVNFADEWKPENLECYRFDCWTLNGKEFSFDTPIRGNVTLTAKWTPIYTVTFDITGGTGDIEARHIAENECASAPSTDPEAASKYKTFAYWSEDGITKFDFDKEKITSDTVLHPVWKDKYTVGGTGPAGGIIFYDVDSDNSDENGGAGSDGLMSSVCLWRYLEAAPKDASETACAWSTDEYNNEFDTAEEIGKGESNTETLLKFMKSSEDNETFPAAQACNIYTCNEFDYWFLPSKDELAKMYEYKDEIGNMKTGKDEGYWTSTSVGSVYADYQFFSNGNSGRETRSHKYYVRPVHQY